MFYFQRILSAAAKYDLFFNVSYNSNINKDNNNNIDYLMTFSYTFFSW